VERGWPRDCSKTKDSCTEMTLTQAEKDLILNEHNALRRKAYEGREAGLPGAKDASAIQDLQWDDGLATLAQEWANTCPGSYHRPNAKTDRFDPAGENMYEGGMNYATYNAVKGWYEEVKDYVKDPNATPAKFGSYNMGQKVGHFTALVWATTTHVGCGVAKKGDTTSVVCNYGPAGNMMGGEVYPVA